MPWSVSAGAPLHTATGPARTSFPSITAHAGSLHTASNARDSFEAALAFPIDYLEADVRFTRNHVAYLSHDVLPESLQSKAMSLEDLMKLAAPHPSVRLNLDMKELSGLREMTGLVHRFGMASRVLLTGLTKEAMPEVLGNASGLPYLLNARPNLRKRFTASGAAELVRAIRACGALGLNTHHRFISRRLARALSEAGLSLSVWTVNALPRMRRMIRLPVDNITTCRVDQLSALRERKA